MTDFSLSPFEMKMLLHHACSPEPFETRATADLVSQSLAHLHGAGLIDRVDFPSATDKGRAWIAKALSTPLPVQEWIWP
jgi:hypothetical protein